MIAYQRSDSIGEFLWDKFWEGGEMSMVRLQWVQIFCEKHQIHKYNRSLHTSIMTDTSHLDWSSLSVGRALGSYYTKYATHITLFYQGKIAIIGVRKQIQMSIYPGKGD